MLAGLAVGFIPGLPDIALEPDLVLLLFLPPLLYGATFFSSPRELRSSARSIGLLAIGLVLVTTVVVAAATHALIPDLPWSAAFVLGAIVAPTDPAAATAVFRHLGVPERVVTVLEGESLVNDGLALVIYQAAVAATVTGVFSLPEATLDVVLSIAGGTAIGIVVGWVTVHVRRRMEDLEVEVTLSLLTPYAAYVPADALGVSGVLAAVTVGLYLSRESVGLFSPGSRLESFAFWRVLQFLLNSLLFLLVGLQFRRLVDAIGDVPLVTVLGSAVLVVVVVIAVRLAWTLIVGRLTPVVAGDNGAFVCAERSQRVLIGWAGMRGAVSLAAALAIPLEAGGGPFPNRELIIFLAFAVILGTLVLQGLTLPAVVRRLVPEEAGREEDETRARQTAAEAALERLDELTADEDLPERVEQRLRERYDDRLRRLSPDEHDDGRDDPDAYRRARLALLQAERDAVVHQWQDGQISTDVMRELERDLDLEVERLDT